MCNKVIHKNMRGRIPQPTKQAKLHGNRKRKGEKEIATPEGWPEKPDYFDDIASKEFDWLCATLSEMGMLTPADRQAIEQYAYSYSEFRKAVDHLNKYGVMLIDPRTQFPKQNPYVKHMRVHQEICRRYQVEFGLTPAARARISLDASRADSGDDFDSFVKLKVV